ncbi:MAG: extensin family protein [Rhodospirillaceae bacterium]|nr:extensin family protein [Rhodospirillaceae bacterium]
MNFGKIVTGLRPPLLALLALAAFGAAGCSTFTDKAETDIPPRAVQRGHLTPAQAMSHSDADAKLLALGIQYRRVQDVEHERGCSIQDAVEISRIGNVKLTRPALLTQDMAVRLGRWVHEVLEPNAQKMYGAQLAAIDVYGSYSCRNIYGKPFGGTFAGRLSEHAFANAVDIGGFKFADGREVAFLKNWRTPGAPTKFLHEASTSACDIFNTTLTPDYDRYHRNHIHIDASPKKEQTQKFCGLKGRFSPGAVPAFARYRVPGKKKWRHVRKRHHPVHKRRHVVRKKKRTT